MSALEPSLPDPLQLYNAYRGCMHGTYDSPGGVLQTLQMVNNTAFYDKSNYGKISVEIDEQGKATKLNWAIHAHEKLALPLFREGVALARVLGDADVMDRMDTALAEELRKKGVPIDQSLPKAGELVSGRNRNMAAEEQFNNIAGKKYVYQAFEMIRAQSMLVLSRDEKIIDQATFERGMADLSARMDKMGLNGIDRMIAASPELEESFLNDKTQMLITENHTKFHPMPEGIFRGRKMPRGEYFRLVNDSIGSDAYKKQQLIHLMMGSGYETAYNDRSKVFREYELTGKTSSDLNMPSEQLTQAISAPSGSVTDQEKMDAYRAWLINYGLGATHERLNDIIAAADKNKSSQQATTPQQITDDSQKKTKAEVDGSPEPAAASQRLGGGSGVGPSPSSGSSSQRTGKSDDNSNGYITAGKLATTAVAGAFLYDGAKHLFGSSDDKKDPDKPQDNSKKFLHAVEAAAAVAGIALVWWKGEAIFKGVGNFFNRGGKSA